MSFPEGWNAREFCVVSPLDLQFGVFLGAAVLLAVTPGQGIAYVLSRTMAGSKHVPVGWPTVIPRIAVDDPEALVAFIQHVFGAVGRFQSGAAIGASDRRLDRHGRLYGDRRAMPAFLYVYVEDTDRVFQRALDRGAKSLEEPQDMPYGDRRAMVWDPWDNTWQIATHRGRFTR